MGLGDDDYLRKQRLYQQANNRYKLKIILLVILTNLVTIYIFTGPLSNSTTLLDELNYAKAQLADSHIQIAELRRNHTSTSLFLEALVDELSKLHANSRPSDDNFGSDIMSEEIKLATGPHKLPLGYHPRQGSDKVYSVVGAGCLRFQTELAKYMNYPIGGECPVDDVFAQRLILKGCEPLPRRRCHPKSPTGYIEPAPFPDSLWTIPPDSSIIWDPYTCKSFQCLNERKKIGKYRDCIDCFDIELGKEKNRWMTDRGFDFGIDYVMNTKHEDGKTRRRIRIGLDIGGGSGTFAARMRERNVTIITSTMNLDGPFNSFIASRGLISIHVSVSQRLPFFENTLDIVHSMHVLSNWIPDTMLEFTLYDIYRVLRPGGLFWLDRFFCLGHQLNTTYVPMLDRIGFRKLRWVDGIKLDRGVQRNESYFSALLEKPLT